MPYDKNINIASTEAIHKRIDALKNRSEDIKGRMADTLINLWNPERILQGVDPETDFSELQKAFPQFSQVIDHVENSVFVSSLTQSPFHMNPTLLEGPPGLGKTLFAKEMANLLGLPYYEISLATISASFALCGGNLQWAEGTVGEITKIISQSKAANPIVLLDEMDKCADSNKYDPTNVLYGLLEPHTAKRFRDEALEVDLDLSHVIWIATANYPERIPTPILSRMNAFEIRQPTPQAMKQVVVSMYSRIRAEQPWGRLLCDTINTEVLNQLSTYSPRDVRLAIDEGALKALKRGSASIAVQDLTRKQPKEARRVGFI